MARGTTTLSDTTPPAFYGGGGTSGYTPSNPKPGSEMDPAVIAARQREVAFQQERAAQEKAAGFELTKANEERIRNEIYQRQIQAEAIRQQSILDMGSLQSTYQFDFDRLRKNEMTYALLNKESLQQQFQRALENAKQQQRINEIKQLSQQANQGDSYSQFPYPTKSTLLNYKPDELKVKKASETEININAALGVPGQYFGSIFNKEFNLELAQRGSKGNIMEQVTTFLDPRYQYDIAKYNEQLRQDTISSRRAMKRLDKANEDLRLGKISYEDYNFIISDISKQEDIKRLSQPRTNVFEAISGYSYSKKIKQKDIQSYGTSQFPYPTKSTLLNYKPDELKFYTTQSDLSEFNKVLYSGGIRVTQTVPYFFAPTRAILGFDIFQEGGKSYELATTKSEKAFAGLQIGLGAALTYSGVKGVYSGITGTTGGTKLTGTPTQLKTFKYVTYGSGTVLGASFGALDYYSTLSTTGSKSVALGAGLGTGGTIVGGLFAPAAYTSIKDTLSVIGKERIVMPKLTDKPFIRRTKGGVLQEVFYTRAEKFKFYDISTYKYKLQGYKPGQLYKRTYRLIDPLVEGKTLGLKEVNFYAIENGKVKQFNKEVTTFPYANPSEHLSLFKAGKGTKGLVQQYYLPKKFILKDILKVSKGVGYTATSGKFVETPEFNLYQKYFSGKGISVYFFRTGTESSGNVQLGGSAVKSSPRLYMAYFETLKKNPAIVELKDVPNPFVKGGKTIKQYSLSLPSTSGTLNIPGYKREVEGVVSGSRTPLKSTYYFKFFGRNIPIEPGAYLTGSTKIDTPTLSNLKTDTKGSSYIPSSYYVPSPFKVSSLNYQGGKGKLKIYTVSYNPKKESYNKPNIYSPSKVKPYSKLSYGYSGVGSSKSVSTPSKISTPTSIIKTKLKYGTSYPTSTPPRITTYNPPITPGQKKGSFIYNNIKYPKQPKGLFTVSIRRQGKFKPLGIYSSLSDAFSVGKSKVSKTLAATFKIEGVKTSGTPFGFYKKPTKQGVLFIEQPKFRLSTGTEKMEIQSYKRNKVRGLF